MLKLDSAVSKHLTNGPSSRSNPFFDFLLALLQLFILCYVSCSDMCAKYVHAM